MNVELAQQYALQNRPALPSSEADLQTLLASLSGSVTLPTDRTLTPLPADVPQGSAMDAIAYVNANWSDSESSQAFEGVYARVRSTHSGGYNEEGWGEWGSRLWGSVTGSFSGYWTNVGLTLKGYFWNGPKNIVVGGYSAVVNYDETIANLTALALQLGEDPQVVIDAFLADLVEQASSPEGQGELFL